jgi:hypothetical protein
MPQQLFYNYNSYLHVNTFRVLSMYEKFVSESRMCLRAHTFDARGDAHGTLFQIHGILYICKDSFSGEDEF